MTLMLASILSESAARYPGRTAVVCGVERVSYAELWEQAGRYAAVLLDRGIVPGDRVAIMLGNVPDFPRAYYAVLAAGAVVVPVHALLTPSEAAYVLRDSGAKLLVCGGPLLATGIAAAAEAGVPVLRLLAGPEAGSDSLERLANGAQALRALVSRDPADDAVILYTSGTTGAPKGAVLSQDNLVRNAEITAFELCAATPEDVLIGCLPLFHSFGQTCVMNAAFRTGASMVLVPRFDGRAVLDLMVAENVTILSGVPTMYIALLDAARNDPRRPPLRRAVSGGASMPLAVLEAFEQAFGTPIYEGYGLSETSPVASFNQPCFGRKPGTVGRGIWGVELAIAEPDVEDRIVLLPPGRLGEVVIRGHNVFKGYLGRPEATAAAVVDGWFRSGDLGTSDADGFISIVDRKKDMILRGGYNVYPREVEEVLMRHPAVAMVAVIGVPHDVHGEEVVAVVVAAGETGSIAGEELIAWSQQHLAKYKYPRHVRFTDALPLGPSGKVLKRELRGIYKDVARG